MDRRLVGPQNRSGCGDEEKKIPALAKNRIPVIQIVVKSL
jgi:hypothetical protein